MSFIKEGAIVIIVISILGVAAGMCAKHTEPIKAKLRAEKAEALNSAGITGIEKDVYFHGSLCLKGKTVYFFKDDHRSLASVLTDTEC